MKFPYSVSIPQHRSAPFSQGKWCEDHFGPHGNQWRVIWGERYRTSKQVTWCFKKERDALLFSLVWS